LEDKSDCDFVYSVPKLFAEDALLIDTFVQRIHDDWVNNDSLDTTAQDLSENTLELNSLRERLTIKLMIQLIFSQHH
jgi:hypothetical protein